MPDLNSIGSWSKSDYERLTADFVSTMTADQIHAMNHTSWMPDAAAAGFTPEMVASINISMYWFGAGWLNNLSTEAIQGLTQTQMAELTANTLCGLDAKHLSALQPEQVSAIKASFYWFNEEWLNNLTIPALQAITPAQLNGLTGANLSKLDSAHAAALTATQMASWITTYYWFSSTFINNLNTQTFQAITAAHLNELTGANFSALDKTHIASLTLETLGGLNDSHLSALSAEQVSAITHLEALSSAQFGLLNISGLPASTLKNLTESEYSALTASQLEAISADKFAGLNLSGLSTSAIGSMSKAVYQKLTPQQIATLSPEQIHAMAHTSWMSDATASAFTPEQVQNISIGMNWFSAEWFNNLSIATFQAMTPAQVGQLSSQTVAALDNEHLHALTADQVCSMNSFGKLSSAQFGLLDISRMPTSVIGNFSDTQYKGLTANQIATLSAEQINAMGHAGWMTDDAASGFTADQIKNCTQNFYWFSPGWFNHLTKEAFQAIKPESMSHIFLDAFNGLDAERRAQLTADQVGGITYNFYFFSSVWFNSLSPDAVKGITADQLGHIQTDNFTHWDNDHLAALTAAQVAVAPHLNALTSEQFGHLDISQLSVSSITQLSKTEYQGLTAQQIASLSAEQIQALQHLSWISPAATQGFSATQMQAFGNDLSGFSGTFLNNLSLDAFHALTAGQLTTLNPVAFVSLDYRHFLALNNFSDLVGLVSSLTTDQLLTLSPMLSPEQKALLPEGQQALINKSVEAGFSLVDSVHDPILKNSLHNVVTNDLSVFSFTTIESALKDLASQLTGDLTESQYNDIKNYVQEIGNVCGTDSAIYSLVNGMIGTNGASVYWSATGDGERIGSLNVGSSAVQFNQLISNWFDGANDPKSSSADHVDGRPVFAKGGPTINDIQQGGVGDCSLLSALQAVVDASPDFIKSMIVQNPNDTYSVRFFKDGVAHWVTVDGNAYSSGTSSATSSWAAIVERANVDFEATYLNETNDYSSLPGGYDKLEEITGDNYTTFRALYTTEDKWNTTDYELLKTAVLNGQPVQFSSWESSKNATTGQTNFVSGHAFAIIGFDDVTNDFILSNPWGAFRNDNVQGTFEASMDQMWQGGNFSTGISIVNSNGAPDAAGQLVHAMAAVNPSPSAALDTRALALNVNNGNLAASHA
ncbi:C2 family cysteine protease [Buttiauxella gaviniae]|uniref:C2 family cysteine protease n=1 Tax=Buttiauxella gaviniae TaxID=82990 RepID=A0ABV3NWW7_9ENTR